MKSTFIIVLSFISLTGVFGQQRFLSEKDPIIGKADSIWLTQLPELKLPEENLRIDLPYQWDNSNQPFLRPVFNQSGGSCGQSAGVGYNFTYEINRARNLLSDTSINQYPSHFVWNFMNGGQGWFGVSYLHSFEILRTLGTPSVYEYGGMYLDNGITWITGYDNYYQAMKNRIRQVYQIPVGTPDGLLTLKHWIQNHLDGSNVGGVANYYAASPWGFQYLPEQSPESGKCVMTYFQGGHATHAMTIVGYNDSIRYDFNIDGQYTNDIDINDDGVVNMKDWEIGGLKFVNSYGDTWADSGYCYLMYKLLADDLNDGGIWNHVIHVLDVKENYVPEMTLKLTIKHDSREKIKITAGISNDTESLLPENVLSFPVFDYQGGHNYMQGGREEEEKKTIEIGLDITPLLSYINPGELARFFVIVHEDDPKQQGTGSIIKYSIIDYNNGGEEIVHPGQNIPLNENDFTRLSVVYNPNFNKINITTEELPASVAGQQYQHQLEADGGTPGYQWDLLTTYHQQSFQTDFPQIDDVLLPPVQPYLAYAEQEIEFEFPFYDETFDKLYIHRDGYIMFDAELYPWPYYNDPFLLFRRMKNISVFLCSPVKYYESIVDSDGMWYEGDENHAAFRWSQPLIFANSIIGHAEFAVILYPDGKIEYYYDEIQTDQDLLWYAGVSAGSNKDYKLIGSSNSTLLPRSNAYCLIPEFSPQQINLDEDGFLSGVPEMDEHIYNLTVRATDDHNIFTKKTFQFSDGLTFSYEIEAGGDSIIQYGETVYLDFTVKNIYNDVFHNLNLLVDCDDPYVNLTAYTATFGNILPGESITIENAIELGINSNCPDKYSIPLSLSFQSDEADWTGSVFLETLATNLFLYKYYIVDGDNNKLDPGETVDLILNISNAGSALANNVSGLLQTQDPYITINAPSLINFGDIQPGGNIEHTYSVTAAENAPIGHESAITFEIEADPQLNITENFSLFIGQFTVLVVNRSQNDISSTAMAEALEDLGIQPVISDTVPGNLDLYRSIFLCMGSFYQNNVLTDQEGVDLASYLDNGGRIYMEGTVTWYMDPVTAVHQKFDLGVVTGSWMTFNGITGIDGTFTEDMAFDFTGAYQMVPYYFENRWPGFSIFRMDTSSVYNMTVASENSGYKTIGAMLEFGLLETESTIEHRKILMQKILEFFNLEDYIVNVVDENKPEYTIVDISNFPNPFSSSTQIQFNLENPTVIDLVIV
nr:hypothetical protein [Bacteroidota bacterium]